MEFPQSLDIPVLRPTKKTRITLNMTPGSFGDCPSIKAESFKQQKMTGKNCRRVLSVTAFEDCSIKSNGIVDSRNKIDICVTQNVSQYPKTCVQKQTQKFEKEIEVQIGDRRDPVSTDLQEENHNAIIDGNPQSIEMYETDGIPSHTRSNDKSSNDKLFSSEWIGVIGEDVYLLKQTNTTTLYKSVQRQCISM